MFGKGCGRVGSLGARSHRTPLHKGVLAIARRVGGESWVVEIPGWGVKSWVAEDLRMSIAGCGG
jgi:hypothetical protein